VQRWNPQDEDTQQRFQEANRRRRRRKRGRKMKYIFLGCLLVPKSSSDEPEEIVEKKRIPLIERYSAYFDRRTTR
jgi:hypothetical protein